MAKIDRMMQLFKLVGEAEGEAVPNGCMHYTYKTSAQERQLADDLANHKNMRQGEGYIVVYDLETSEVIDKLELPI